MTQRRQAALVGALLLATAAAYLPALDGEFLFDDEFTLKEPLLRDPLGQGPGAWLAASRPATLLTFAANHLAVGLDTRGWHLTNLLIHLSVVVLAWRFLRRTLERAGAPAPALPALAAAALFALHPLQSEVVAYLYQRGEALAAGLWLGALLLLLARDEATAAARRAALLGGAALLLALGLLSKPTAATLPAAWLLHAALLPAPREAGWSAWARIRSRLAAAAPLLLLSLGAAVRELALARGTTHAGLGVPGLPPHLYLATQLRVIPTYLGLALWPAGQCADWTFPASRGLLEAPVLAGGVLLLALAGGAVALAARAAGRASAGAAAARAGAFGVLLFLLALAPSSSVIPLLDPLAEHRLYLPLLGLALSAAAGGAWLLGRWPGARALPAGAALALAASLALGLATARRAAVWDSMLSLWGDAAAREPQKARVLVNLGSALFAAGRVGEAEAAYRRAWALRADRTAAPEVLLLGLVDALSHAGRFDEARAAIHDVLAGAPDSAQAHGLLAEVEWRSSRLPACQAAAERALALDPRQHQALKYLGLIRMAFGDLPAARDLLRRSAAAEPRDATVQMGIGEAEQRLGNRPAACAAYARAAGEPGFERLAPLARSAAQALGCGAR